MRCVRDNRLSVMSTAFVAVLVLCLRLIDCQPCDTETYSVSLHGSAKFLVHANGTCSCDRFTGSGSALELQTHPTVEYLLEALRNLTARVQDLETWGRPGSPCVSDTDCRRLLFCEPDLLRCRGGTNASCSINTDCLPSLICTSAGVCQSATTTAGVPSTTSPGTVATTGAASTTGRLAASCVAEPPPHGSVSAAVVANASSVNYTCDSGYTIAGAVTRMCVNGNLMGSLPVCNPNPCPVPPLLGGWASGRTVQANVPSGTVINYTCSAELRLVGASNRTCEAGTLLGEQPACVADYVATTCPAAANTPEMVAFVGGTTSVTGVACRTGSSACGPANTTFVKLGLNSQWRWADRSRADLVVAMSDRCNSTSCAALALGVDTVITRPFIGFRLPNTVGDATGCYAFEASFVRVG